MSRIQSLFVTVIADIVAEKYLLKMGEEIIGKIREDKVHTRI